MTWELIEAEPVEATLDDSGVYVVINRVVTQETHKEYSETVFRVRADLMSTADGVPDMPIVSFIGTANDVRKHLIRFIRDRPCNPAFSFEHASYIGYELHRAETDENYVQD